MLKFFLFIIILILLGTLFPYDFYGMTNFHSFSGLWNEGTAVRSDFLQDFIANVLLFLPLGFALAGFFAERKLSRAWRLLIVALAGFFLSSGIEIAQIFLPSRITSIYDILGNTLGTVFGEIIFYLYGSFVMLQATRIGRRLAKIFTKKRLLISVFIYMVIFLAFTKTLPNAASFKTWDLNYSLLVGNEKSGDRPWKGIIRKFAIWNLALSPERAKRVLNNNMQKEEAGGNIDCLYDITASDPLKDKTGKLPDLYWLREKASVRENKSIYLDRNHWLSSMKPVPGLVKNVKATNQFSIFIVLATANRYQNGPARILSLSADPYHRDFTLAQDKKDLIFRLRTPLTGENGNEPEFIARNVFSHTDGQELLVTFDGKRLRLFVDGKAKSSMLFSQGAMFFKKMVRLNLYEMSGYDFLYHFLFVAPLLAVLFFFIFGRTHVVKIPEVIAATLVREKA